MKPREFGYAAHLSMQIGIAMAHRHDLVGRARVARLSAGVPVDQCKVVACRYLKEARNVNRRIVGMLRELNLYRVRS